MAEELACSGELLQTTGFEKIFEIPNKSVEDVSFRRNLEALIWAAHKGDQGFLLETLISMGLGYHPLTQVAVPPADLDQIAYAS